MVRSLVWVCANIKSSVHPLKLTRTSVKLTGKLVRDVARLVSIMIIRDDVISNVIRPGSTIHEDHIDTPYRGTLCSSIVQFWQELSEKKHFEEKKCDVIIVTSSGHVTSSGACAVDSIAHMQVPIGCTLKPYHYLASFPRYLAPKWRQWLYVMTSSVTS